MGIISKVKKSLNLFFIIFGILFAVLAISAFLLLIFTEIELPLSLNLSLIAICFTAPFLFNLIENLKNSEDALGGAKISILAGLMFIISLFTNFLDQIVFKNTIVNSLFFLLYRTTIMFSFLFLIIAMILLYQFLYEPTQKKE